MASHEPTDTYPYIILRYRRYTIGDTSMSKSLDVGSEKVVNADLGDGIMQP